MTLVEAGNPAVYPLRRSTVGGNGWLRVF